MSLVSLASVVSRGSTKPRGIARNADNTQDNDQLFVMVEIEEKRESSRTKPPFDTGLSFIRVFLRYTSTLCVTAVCVGVSATRVGGGNEARERER